MQKQKSAGPVPIHLRSSSAIMKAFVYTRYGEPADVLEIKEMAKPQPKENEVLVKIAAAAINDYDWSMVRGRPLIYRLMTGISKPKQKILGMELSGTVEETGHGVSKFQIGDEVFGDISEKGFGSFAEFICVHEDALVKKPAGISFTDAAALPHASLLAWQGLHKNGKIKQGEKVLVNGGGGGVGSYAVQYAKLLNCEVTGVDTGAKLDEMKNMGYDKLIDYKKNDFTRTGIKYDLVFDCRTNRWPAAYLRSLKTGGRYVTVGGSPAMMLLLVTMGKLLTSISSKYVGLVMLKPNQGIEEVLALFQSKKIKTVIDGPYPMEKIPALIKYFGEGKHKGKIVVKMDS